FLPLGILVCLEIGISYISLKSPLARGWIYGFPTVVIAKGKVLDTNMRKLRYNTNDLLAQLRDKGIMNPADVEYAILEVPGTLSVIPKPDKRAVTPEDLKLQAVPNDCFIPIVLDGVIHKPNLALLKQSEAWVIETLARENLTPAEVFMATYSAKEGLKISSKKGESIPPCCKFLEH
ncbi:MAG: DUF421 domain-containing protein, partial [Peptococcaceae bacterium]|nr:DUF421 domain-containing protein [Peptococcaceae bacterium]